MILRVTGADSSLVRYEESEILTTKAKLVDTSKSVRDLDHKNSYSLEDGMRLTADWMRKVYEPAGGVSASAERPRLPDQRNAWVCRSMNSQRSNGLARLVTVGRISSKSSVRGWVDSAQPPQPVPTRQAHCYDQRSSSRTSVRL